MSKKYKDMDLKEFSERGQIINFRIKTCKERLEALDNEYRDWESEAMQRLEQTKKHAQDCIEKMNQSLPSFKD